MKIVIPTNLDKRAKLAKDIMGRATQDGEKSPIKTIISDPLKAKIETVEVKAKQANEYRRQVEVLIEERNNLMKEVDQFIRSSRDILTGIFPNEPKKLTEYGFEVDENRSKKSSAPKK
ncbi:hypothetical protein [uncultured Acetobacteroides sp.]|uniref:hypothetical protein n=1 Tax=uncultured Acetobacteroides sp. TaxID=1760811 RepID=UPI0029F5C712|nr:hypothetical protein [uncultured Acetobacteroides sp.]